MTAGRAGAARISAATAAAFPRLILIVASVSS